MRVDPRSNCLLRGVVGSTAYGLNHADSDKDYIGLFAVPTNQLLGLDAPEVDKAIEFKNPDSKYYEAGHYARLALKCNPSILELMWLEHYSLRTQFGNQLIAIRDAFPSAKLVKAAYMGYATQQLERLDRNSDFDKRAKNARHFARLLYQGSMLYLTGVLIVRLPDPEKYFAFGEKVANGDVAEAQALVNTTEKIFNGKSALPNQPDKKIVNEWLLGVRHGLYQRPDSNPN